MFVSCQSRTLDGMPMLVVEDNHKLRPTLSRSPALSAWPVVLVLVCGANQGRFVAHGPTPLIRSIS